MCRVLCVVCWSGMPIVDWHLLYGVRCFMLYCLYVVVFVACVIMFLMCVICCLLVVRCSMVVGGWWLVVVVRGSLCGVGCVVFVALALVDCWLSVFS